MSSLYYRQRINPTKINDTLTRRRVSISDLLDDYESNEAEEVIKFRENLFPQSESMKLSFHSSRNSKSATSSSASTINSVRKSIKSFDSLYDEINNSVTFDFDDVKADDMNIMANLSFNSTKNSKEGLSPSTASGNLINMNNNLDNIVAPVENNNSVNFSIKNFGKKFRNFLNINDNSSTHSTNSKKNIFNFFKNNQPKNISPELPLSESRHVAAGKYNSSKSLDLNSNDRRNFFESSSEADITNNKYKKKINSNSNKMSHNNSNISSSKNIDSSKASKVSHNKIVTSKETDELKHLVYQNKKLQQKKSVPQQSSVPQVRQQNYLNQPVTYNQNLQNKLYLKNDSIKLNKKHFDQSPVLKPRKNFNMCNEKVNANTISDISELKKLRRRSSLPKNFNLTIDTEVNKEKKTEDGAKSGDSDKTLFLKTITYSSWLDMDIEF
ncbi:hypothetical protein HK099_000735 [Clydaea vesicula]|uniref:Uncharacterized protein n=1 Tax=Clydaea vesicula TaxID=447962 RepID=A0AAD5TV21_9FUNG|nr:hypothetical protein HK099_000735 [Clydaea vesicula]